jgi:hypothetical protein
VVPKQRKVQITKSSAKNVDFTLTAGSPPPQSPRGKPAPSSQAQFKVRVQTIPGGEFGNTPIPLESVRVTVSHNGRQIARGLTDRNGGFVAKGTKGTVCSVRAEHVGYEPSSSTLTIGHLKPTTIILKARSSPRGRASGGRASSGPRMKIPDRVNISGQVHAPSKANFGQAELLDGNKRLIRSIRVSSNGRYSFTGLVFPPLTDPVF